MRVSLSASWGRPVIAVIFHSPPALYDAVSKRSPVQKSNGILRALSPGIFSRDIAMVFSLSDTTTDLIGYERARSRIRRAHSLLPGIMKDALIWLENEEQVAGFRAATRSKRLPRLRLGGLHPCGPDPGDPGILPASCFLRSIPTAPTTAEIGCILRPQGPQERVRLGYPPGAARVRIRTAWPPPGGTGSVTSPPPPPRSTALEKGGLVYEGTLREHVWLRDHWRSTRYYGMLAGDDL